MGRLGATHLILSLNVQLLTSMNQRTVKPWAAEAFEERYRSNSDPWNFAASAYEQDRYRQTMESLLRERYGAAFEPGCSIGELTAMLASRCRTVLATDVSESAVARAKLRCKALANVEIAHADLTDALERGPFDLIVLSEIAYYFRAPDLVDIAARLPRQLLPGGELIAVHWLGHSSDHRLHGNKVHEILLKRLALQWVRGMHHGNFRIDTWIRS